MVDGEKKHAPRLRSRSVTNTGSEYEDIAGAEGMLDAERGEHDIAAQHVNRDRSGR